MWGTSGKSCPLSAPTFLVSEVTRLDLLPTESFPRINASVGLIGMSGDTERPAQLHAGFPEVSGCSLPLAKSQGNSFTKLSRKEVAGLCRNRFTTGVL